jgi:aryl-alcohol dehydrogenase-like predicted oxidoreductase
MRYTELGKTGMKISHISFGASSLGSVFRETNEKESFEAVEAAIDGGINFIDVSPYYGHYKAETVLGKALRNIPREKYYLSTKVGRYGKDGINTWDYSAKRVTDSVYESMERLGIDFIDLINVHDIEFQAALPGGLQKVVDETLPALFELKAKGVVGHVGITDLQLQNLKWVIDQIAAQGASAHQVESILNFCHYTLNDSALEDYLGFFEQQGVGVVNASPLSMGLLSQRGVPAWHPAPNPLVKACQKAADYCREKGYPIEKLAVQYSVSNPRIASTLFSSANPANVKRNIEWANEEPDWQLVQEVKEIIGDQQRVTWANS